MFEHGKEISLAGVQTRLLKPRLLSPEVTITWKHREVGQRRTGHPIEVWVKFANFVEFNFYAASPLSRWNVTLGPTWLLPGTSTTQIELCDSYRISVQRFSVAMKHAFTRHKIFEICSLFECVVAFCSQLFWIEVGLGDSLLSELLPARDTCNFKFPEYFIIRWPTLPTHSTARRVFRSQIIKFLPPVVTTMANYYMRVLLASCLLMACVHSRCCASAPLTTAHIRCVHPRTHTHVCSCPFLKFLPAIHQLQCLTIHHPCRVCCTVNCKLYTPSLALFSIRLRSSWPTSIHDKKFG